MKLISSQPRSSSIGGDRLRDTRATRRALRPLVCQVVNREDRGHAAESAVKSSRRLKPQHRGAECQSCAWTTSGASRKPSAQLETRRARRTRTGRDRRRSRRCWAGRRAPLLRDEVQTDLASGKPGAEDSCGQRPPPIGTVHPARDRLEARLLCCARYARHGDADVVAHRGAAPWAALRRRRPSPRLRERGDLGGERQDRQRCGHKPRILASPRPANGLTTPGFRRIPGSAQFDLVACGAYRDEVDKPAARMSKHPRDDPCGFSTDCPYPLPFRIGRPSDALTRASCTLPT